MMRFHNFGIESPVYLGEPPMKDYKKYIFDVVKYQNISTSGKETNFVIGTLFYDPKDFCFKFSSCGLRYLEERVEGLEEWLLAWCKLKEIEFKYEESKEN